MSKIKPELEDDVAETLFIPLLSRAIETRRKNGLINDPKACEMVDKVDYDFSKFGNIKMSTIGTIIRVRHFDKAVQDFIDRKAKEKPVIVQVGCGLDTRYFRISDHEQAVFYEMDLPEVIHLREKLIPSSQNDIYLSSSLLKSDWIEALKQKHSGSPFLFLFEGVLMYFTEEQVRDVLSRLADHFPGSEIYFDKVSNWACRNSDKHESVKKTKARFHCGIDDPHIVEKWVPKLKLIETFYFVSEAKGRWGVAGFLMSLIPGMKKAFGILGYKIM